MMKLKKEIINKNSVKYLFSMLLMALMTLPSFGQEQTKMYYDYGRPWAIGIHGGASWMQTDIDARLGWGLGLDLGKRMVGNRGDFFAVDWRGRLTYTQNYGQGSTLISPTALATNPAYNGSFNSQIDYTDTSGVGMFHNFRHDMLSLNLELPITFNKLRERTGWTVQLFPGIGLGIYDVGTDQLTSAGEIYDYSNINPIESRGRIRRDIVRLRDRTYFDDPNGFENGTLRGTFSGQLGLGVGYHFKPWLSAGLEHRAIFAMSDRLDGLEQSGDLDIKHLTNLYVRYHFGQDNRVAPIINITSPETCPYETRQSSATLLAEILHVDSRSDIVCTVNGIPNNAFSYNTSTDKFSVTLLLKEGANEVTIRASNAVGTDVESCVIIYNPPITSGNAPVITYQRPNRNPFTTRDGTYNVVARVDNITNKQNVRIRVNGRNITNFRYNTRNNTVSTTLNLEQGANTCEITATNNYGTDVQTTTIVREAVVINPPPTPLPQVTITQPNANPYNTQSRTEVVRATIANVPNRNGVTVTVNGNRTNSFNYRNGQLVTEIELRPGSTTVTIEGRNQAGSASDAVTIIKEQQAQPPTVNITQPNRNPYSTTRSSETVRAVVRNVTNKNNVSVQVNGVSTRNFSYNTSNGQLTTEVALRQGNNTVTITGSNQAGSASDVVSINYKRNVEPQAPPVITINSPQANPYTSKTNKANIRARITNIVGKQNVTFMVNGTTTTNFNYNASTDIFSASINLIEGSNTFEIYAANEAGNDQYIGTIIYRNIVVPDLPPIVNIIKPSANPYNTKNGTEGVQARIQNITSKNQITMTVNGQTTNNFTFANKTLNAQVPLVEGANTVVISASNSGGTASKSVTIIYKKDAPQPAPVVTITTPQNGSTTNQPTQLVKATIQNVTSKNQVTFTVNGKKSTAFSYNAANDQFSANVNLINGLNKVEITATNNSGTDRDQSTITFKTVTVKPPTVTITNPTRNLQIVYQPTQVVEATVKNIVSKNQITFKVNGAVNNNFSYNIKDQKFSSTVNNLVSGANKFEITATNTAGSDRKDISVMYRVGGNAPIISMIGPASNPYSTVQGTMAFKATIKNITSKNDVTFKVNNKPTSFNFNPTSKQFTSNVTLVPGNNVFEITANNNFGNAKVSGTVIYKAVAQKPVITLVAPRNNPFTTTNANEVVKTKITNITGKQNIEVRVDGSPVTNFSYNTSTKLMTLNRTWKSGTNVVSIKATNTGGIDTEVVRINYSKPLPPTIKLTLPQRNAITTSKATERVTATIQNVGSMNDISFKINGSNSRKFSYSTGKKIFSANVPLRVGNNTFEIVAINPQGQDNVKFSIKYEKAQKPVIQIITPKKNPYTSTQREELTAKVLYVSGKSAITVKVNGQLTDKWRFNNSTKMMAVDYAWNVGNNTVLITATNAAGTTTKTQIMIYKPVTRPSITITKPTKNINTTKASEQVRATITGVSTNTDITLKINGATTRNFNFDRETGAFSKMVALKNGANTIQISAKNAGGTKTVSRVITYTPVVVKPTIQLINPNKTTSTSNKKNFTMRAKLNGVTAKSQITFTVNGTRSTSYSFNTSTQQFSANLSLKNGANSILIAVQNSKGADLKTLNITYQPTVNSPSNRDNNRGGNNGGTSNRTIKSSKTKTASTTSKGSTRTIKKPTIKKPTIKVPKVLKPKSSSTASTSKRPTSSQKSTSTTKKETEEKVETTKKTTTSSRRGN